MMDRRLTPSNGRVAHVSLRSKISADRFVEGEWRQVAVPLADLSSGPGAGRERQLLLGDRFRVLEARHGWAFGFAEDGGYVGYLPEASLGQAQLVTHRVSAPATHLYSAPNIKSRDLAALTLGSGLSIVAEKSMFAVLDTGAFIPRAHVRPLTEPAPDPAAVAELLHGTPYLWGGDSRWGIDCSGLVHTALRAAGISCPRDSDLQLAEIGTVLSDADALRRGDLLFWKGHVAMVTDPATMIHATAHFMAVVLEPIADAIARIEAQGGGPVTGRRRR